jgi:hypothetical protein
MPHIFISLQAASVTTTNEVRYNIRSREHGKLFKKSYDTQNNQANLVKRLRDNQIFTWKRFNYLKLNRNLLCFDNPTAAVSRDTQYTEGITFDELIF